MGEPDAGRPSSRRRFLVLCGAVAAGAAGAEIGNRLLAGQTPEPRHGHRGAAGRHRRSPGGMPGQTPQPVPPLRTVVSSGGKWSDSRTWNGPVPDAASLAVISRDTELDVNAAVGGVEIRPGASLRFAPGRSVTLTSRGNVVVEGTLAMRQTVPTATHTLRFVDIDEAAFGGGGMSVMPSDVGLWVPGSGTLDLEGAAKRAWTRASAPIAAGGVRVELDDDPTGWQRGDAVAIAPTLATTDTHFAAAYDETTIASVDGRTVTLASPARFDHPTVPTAAGTFGAEVLNLTRNVRVEGTPGGRTHVWIHSTRPSRISSTEIRYTGPRQKQGKYSEAVLGRYGLHIHMAGSGSRGTLVQSAVVHDSGSHAFVPHMSDGISFHDCISHNTLDEPYWWDRTPGEDMTNDVLWDRCVASAAGYVPAFRGYHLTGFLQGKGMGNVARDCVAVGIGGRVNASGFAWLPPRKRGTEGVWTFEGCVAHNNAVSGLFVWQNTRLVHRIDRFLAYHNGSAGIDHGAYRNPYQYLGAVLYGNGVAGVLLHATGRSPGLKFQNVSVDGAGTSKYGFLAERSPVHGQPAELIDVHIARVSDRDLAVAKSAGTIQDRFAWKG